MREKRSIRFWAGEVLARSFDGKSVQLGLAWFWDTIAEMLENQNEARWLENCVLWYV
jgi:hypothetical protein